MLVFGRGKPMVDNDRHTATPAFVARLGKRFVGWAQRQFYERYMRVHIQGQAHVPTEGGFLVAANHTSHLDQGLVKMALGSVGQHLASLAARDYFFANRVRRWYFENFTNLMPLARNGTFKSTLRLAMRTLAEGTPLLIFPEGTRSIDGQMAPFKPAIGSMAMATGSPVVPIYLEGTHTAMPKGSMLWPKHKRLAARIGPAIPAALLCELSEGLPKRDASRLATSCIQLAVCALRDGEALTPDVLKTRMQPQLAKMHRANAETELAG
jgi:long-chain acyl-CoA synthetase